MRSKERTLKSELSVYLPATLVLVVGFAIAFQFIKPAPPRHVVIATGEPSGAYYAFALRYREIFARQGIELEVRETAGSVENIRLLATGGADVGFVQGGTVNGAADGTGITSLGSLYFEPLWMFHREGLVLDRLPALAGLDVATGTEGSGTRALVRRLLAANGVTGVRERALHHREVVAGLVEGTLDAAFVVGSPTGATVRTLLAAPGIATASFERAEAYARRYRFLSRLTLPEGAMDLAANLPPRDVELLAPAANLAAGPDLHPAIIDLLLLAAQEVHAAGGWFEARYQFPQAEYLELPLNGEAGRFYKHGPPLLQRYLPFWAASLVDRLKVMLVPLVVLLFPLVKVMPPVYSWRMRSRIYRWYAQLEAVDDAVDTAGPGDAERLLTELGRLESDVLKVTVPLSFAGQLYHLRQHIEFVRQRIRHTVEVGAPPPSAIPESEHSHE